MFAEPSLQCPCLWQSRVAASDVGVLGLQNHIMGRLSMNTCLMAGGSSWFVRKRCAFTCAFPPVCMPSLTYPATPFALCIAFLASSYPALGLLGHPALHRAVRLAAHLPVSGQAIIPKMTLLLSCYFCCC